MAKRKGSSAPSSSRARKKADRDAREAENAQRLDKLPQEVWEKILDELESDDLFPLALSCRYFRQKQKELLARTRQSRVPGSGKPRLALKTNLRRKLWNSKPASVKYLQSCRKEKLPKVDGLNRARYIRCLAAYHGHLPLLQKLQAGLKTLDSGIATEAARGGQVETLKWLKTQEGFTLSWNLFSAACDGGHLEMMKWLRSEGCPWNADACKWAARGGHLEALKWLKSKGCPWDEEACKRAAGGGQLETLKWLRSEGCPWNEGACRVAAQGGHLDVLKWLRSEGCPWYAGACSRAAEGGHLETLKWLRSQGCPWDDWTCAHAALGGHLDVLKYARENGCPWDANTWRFAAESTREWLKENGCPQQ